MPDTYVGQFESEYLMLAQARLIFEMVERNLLSNGAAREALAELYPEIDFGPRTTVSAIGPDAVLVTS